PTPSAGLPSFPTRRSSDLAWSEAEAVLRRADVVLNFHYAIDPRLLAYARRTALVDIDPGLLQFWMSTGQLNVPAHDCNLTTGERSEEHTSELQSRFDLVCR